MKMLERVERFFEKIIGGKPVSHSDEYKTLVAKLDQHENDRIAIWGDSCGTVFKTKDFKKPE